METVEGKNIIVRNKKYSVGIVRNTKKEGDISILVVGELYDNIYYSLVHYQDYESAYVDYQKFEDGMMLSPHRERFDLDILDQKQIVVNEKLYFVEIRTGFQKPDDIGIYVNGITENCWVEYPDLDSARKDYDKFRDGVLLSQYKEELDRVRTRRRKRNER